MRIALVLLVLWPVASWAQDRAMLPRECRVERLEQALSACIDHAAAQIADHMDARIAMATSDLQAATGPELQAFERGLRRSQDAWRLAAASACEVSGRGAPVQEALCGLEAARLRKDRLETTLAELRTRMGADPLYPVPDADAVEVLIPLELPPGVGGPDSDVRVPLVIPVTPQ